MPEHDNTTETRYYVIERVGVEPHKRYLKTIGHQLIINDPWDQKPADPTFGPGDRWFKWHSYTAACHWLARWKPAGTYRVVYVNEETDQFQAVDRPVDPERMDERDWREFTHMNGKSN